MFPWQSFIVEKVDEWGQINFSIFQIYQTAGGVLELMGDLFLSSDVAAI